MKIQNDVRGSTVAREWASSDADEHRAHLSLAAFNMLLKPIEPWFPHLLKPINNICLKWDSAAKPRAQSLPLSRVTRGGGVCWAVKLTPMDQKE